MRYVYVVAQDSDSGNLQCCKEGEFLLMLMSPQVPSWWLQVKVFRLATYQANLVIVVVDDTALIKQSL